ncbi:PREDICTED: palmitoyltransferase ZDHHC23 [Ceratosolen solmsi marchali]|uniref:Palmitoyltransferase n=1 Tax=Ceratosolen solmsi marchali TaxID=326594 RepID=A0AAJ6YL55_9HYME|nr:PREDICTED: palmitoyltransferase ZDHHC23 [Ceratosolen solmsi marchali]
MRFCGRFLCNPCTWQEGGVRQLSFDALIPIFTVPILMVVASQSFTCTVIIFLLSPPLIYYFYRNFLRFIIRTKFFLMWTVTSVLTLLLVFEFSVVPLLEILPEENLVFVICVVGGLVCGYKTKQKACQVTQENSLLQGVELGEGDSEICNICKKCTSQKAFHCRLCQTCINEREYHCKWLDCCVGASNLRWYLTCLLFSAVAFIYGSNLTMTSVCHPFILIGTILLPDDCSDVYHQLDIAICFVSSIYSLLIGLVITFYLIYHFWLLYLGKTANERHLLNNENENNEGVLRNATKLFCCKL